MRCGLDLELTFAFKLKFAGGAGEIAEIAMITFCIYIGLSEIAKITFLPIYRKNHS